MPNDPIPSDWTYQSLADYKATHKVQNHSSRVHYPDTDAPIVEVPPPAPAP